mmetsp:Transcript_35051/g.98833  ORF Transcript_35051/g.98833 Transcript_35051/m.98833 type:complete len:303 (+) Transcript_35051:79-987(+)
MQHDEVIWQVINQGFCSFKAKVGNEQTFCRHKMNVSGLCLRQACPLANSRYATVREEEGKVYLYMKTIERAHSPAKMWEKVKLDESYAKALEQIDSHLAYWPKYNVHKCKQRLTKITQYLIRMRKLRGKPRPELIGIKRKEERRERTREAKALKAAELDNSIKKELLTRLKKGVYEGLYDDILSTSDKQFQEVLDELELEEESEADSEAESEEEYEGEFENEGEDLEVLSDEDGEYDREDLEDISISGITGSSASSKSRTRKRGDVDAGSSSTSKKRRRKHVELEFETEESLEQEAMEERTQ